MARIAWIATAAWVLCTGCRDLSNFTTSGDRFEGQVVVGDFVRAGVDAKTCLCLTLDANHLQDAPGAVSTSDGRFEAALLRPIPQIWNDPLSGLSFGEGRLRNLIYVANAGPPFGGDGGKEDALVIVSLMQTGDVEVRLLRGAPVLSGEGGPATSAGDPLFAVFDLSRKSGACFTTGPCSF